MNSEVVYSRTNKGVLKAIEALNVLMLVHAAQARIGGVEEYVGVEYLPAGGEAGRENRAGIRAGQRISRSHNDAIDHRSKQRG